MGKFFVFFFVFCVCRFQPIVLTFRFCLFQVQLRSNNIANISSKRKLWPIVHMWDVSKSVGSSKRSYWNGPQICCILWVSLSFVLFPKIYLWNKENKCLLFWKNCTALKSQFPVASTAKSTLVFHSNFIIILLILSLLYWTLSTFHSIQLKSVKSQRRWWKAPKPISRIIFMLGGLSIAAPPDIILSIYKVLSSCRFSFSLRFFKPFDGLIVHIRGRKWDFAREHGKWSACKSLLPEIDFSQT